MSATRRTNPSLRTLLRAFLALLLVPLSLAAQTSGGTDQVEIVGGGGGLTARSADGNHALQLGAAFQLRPMATLLPEEESTDRLRAGFQARRLQVNLQGHTFSPRWTFRLRLDSTNGSGVSAGFAWVGYQAEGGTSVRIGQLKPAFLQEELIPAIAQLAIERSYTSDYFTTDFSHGLQVSQRLSPRVSLITTLHTGSYGWRTDYEPDRSEFALAARSEWLLMSQDPAVGRGQFQEFQHWEGDPPALLLGIALDYELGESSGRSGAPDVLKWTVDLTGKARGITAHGALMGQRMDATTPGSSSLPAKLDGASQFGWVLQLSGFLVPTRWDAFVRMEGLDFDGVYFRMNQGSVDSGTRDLPAEADLRIVTFGGSRYLSRQGLKLSLDLTHALDPVPVANPGVGLLGADHGGQSTLRSQIQLRF